jgi:hypothetical protein
VLNQRTTLITRATEVSERILNEILKQVEVPL